MSRPVRLGFISFAHGHQGSYAWNAKRMEGVTLAGVADSDAARGRKMAEQFGMPWFRTPRELLQQGVDAVSVASENARHAEHVLACAQARVHVVCEKPLATTMADGRRMVEACRKAGVFLATAFPMRFSTPVVQAHRRLHEDAIGRVLAVAATNHGSFPGGWFAEPRLSGGGATMDHTVHVADLLRWMLHDEVAEVYAEVGTLLRPKLKCDDCGLLSMRFRRGTIATLDASWSRTKGFPTWGDVTLKLWGERGVITVDAFAQRVMVWGAERPWHSGFGDNADAGLVADFIEAVRENRPPSVTGEDGLRAVEVALAAYRSARRGQPVQLPL